MQLLKQLTNTPAASIMGTSESGSAGNGTNTLMALLQQLGSAQPQSQQPAQQPAQQQPSQPIKQQSSASVEPLPSSKSTQDNNTSAGQDSLHMALKQILEQQSVAAPAMNGMPQTSVAMSYPSTQPMASAQRGYQFDTSQLLQLDPNILGSLLEQTTAARARAPPVSTRHSIDNSFLAAKILGMSGQMEPEGAGQGTMMPMQVSIFSTTWTLCISLEKYFLSYSGIAKL